MSPVSNLDGPCGTCGRRSGDHTLDEWAKCLGTTTTDLPFEEIPEDTAAAASKAVRERFELDEDLIVADHVVVHAATLAGSSGVVDVKVPTVLSDFQIGIPGKPPELVARIAFLGDVDGIRGYGRLVRDSANAAANVAEGKPTRNQRRRGR